MFGIDDFMIMTLPEVESVVDMLSELPVESYDDVPDLMRPFLNSVSTSVIFAQIDEWLCPLFSDTCYKGFFDRFQQEDYRRMIYFSSSIVKEGDIRVLLARTHGRATNTEFRVITGSVFDAGSNHYWRTWDGMSLSDAPALKNASSLLLACPDSGFTSVMYDALLGRTAPPLWKAQIPNGLEFPKTKKLKRDFEKNLMTFRMSH